MVVQNDVGTQTRAQDVLVHCPGMVRGPHGRAGGGEAGVRGGEDWEKGVGSDQVEDLEGLGVEPLLAEVGDVDIG